MTEMSRRSFMKALAAMAAAVSSGASPVHVAAKAAPAPSPELPYWTGDSPEWMSYNLCRAVKDTFDWSVGDGVFKKARLAPLSPAEYKQELEKLMGYSEVMKSLRTRADFKASLDAPMPKEWHAFREDFKVVADVVFDPQKLLRTFQEHVFSHLPETINKQPSSRYKEQLRQVEEAFLKEWDTLPSEDPEAIRWAAEKDLSLGKTYTKAVQRHQLHNRSFD